ncbi:MAG: ATP-binding protein [Bacteroidota bacterium]
MVNEQLAYNAQHLELELAWFDQVLSLRMDLYFGRETSYQSILDFPPPVLDPAGSLYAGFLDQYALTVRERLALLLALTPHIRPHLLDVFFTRNETYDRDFTEFGGIKGVHHKGFLPTGQTLHFLLAGEQLETGFSVLELFDEAHVFTTHHIVTLATVPEGEPLLSGALRISGEVCDHITRGIVRKPAMSMRFPARRITTELHWDDLVLRPETQRQLNELSIWMEHYDTLLNDWGLKSRLRPGYRCLFYGPPGTGKSVTASVLGKTSGRDVYRVDLSMVISKYIGETEKNLARVFDKAEHKDWILFFDEADALFGKRTGVSDAHDRYANQGVSFLLQRIEVFDGIAILASNMKNNLDDAFTRRFENVIHFPMPGEEERFLLWQKGFSQASVLHERVDLRKLARKYELSGGTTMNVIRYSSLMALKRNSNEIMLTDIEEGIRREYLKEGRTI